MTAGTRPWWKDGVVYQIYPASFKDSNGDGVGDLRGIADNLDYIKELGADIVWICPMYDSPQHDMGYDIRDYKQVYAPYGTVEDMEALIQQAHSKNMRVVLDLVVNHTSNEHAWFKESASSETNPKRDWYIWKPARYDADGKRQPPTNWRSCFGGSAWQWDETTQEYYLHLFCPEQPDLNWENEETRKAIYADAMVYWLEKGVDGFRIDTVNMYSKPPTYPDAPITDPNDEFQPAGLVYCNGPRMHEYLGEMNEILSRYDAMSVGECPHTPDFNRVVQYVSASQKQLNMVFQFDVVDTGMGAAHKYATTPGAWKLPQFKNAIASTQSLLSASSTSSPNLTDAWTTAFLENHDQARSISRFGNDSPAWRERSGKMLALLLASLSGTLYIYQGQEIGMINAPLSWDISEYKDVESSNYYYHAGFERTEENLKAAKASLQHLARDHARTPMQWTDAAHGGFTTEDATAEPWMRVNDSKDVINVAAQRDDKESVLGFWKQMLALRREKSQVLVHGIFELLDEANEKVMCFTKTGAEEKVVVVCNFSDEEQPLPDVEVLGQQPGAEKLRYLAGNVDEYGDALEPWEGRIYVVD